MLTFGRSLAVSLLLVSTVAAADPPGPVEQIRRVLEDQIAAWNRHDLEGYMAGYWRSPELTFYGGSGVTRGWQATLERYRKQYQSDGREMGKLDISDQTIDLLGDGAALVRGRWHLSFSGGKEGKGLFTVILRRLPEGWRIIHDHSSVHQ